jgi:hypothetical protein
MKIVILKDKSAFEQMPRKNLFAAHFVGYWNSNDKFTIVKDRYYGQVGLDITAVELNNYLKKFT